MKLRARYPWRVQLDLSGATRDGAGDDRSRASSAERPSIGLRMPAWKLWQFVVTCRRPRVARDISRPCARPVADDFWKGEAMRIEQELQKMGFVLPTPKP